MTEKEELIQFHYGPQHPGSHPFSLLLSVDGDIISDVKVQIGYVHRGLAKQAEYRTFMQSLPLMERSCFIDPINHLWGYVTAVEKLTDTKVPERAEYLRVVSAEISRMNSLISWWGGFVSEAGVSTAFMWSWADREKFLDIFGHLAGSRVSATYLTIGGVRWDWNTKLEKMTYSVLDYMEKRIAKYKKFIMKNKLFKKRTIGVGVVTKKQALDWAFTGPNLRASGIFADARINDPYGIYDRFKFKPKVYTEGDSFARTMVRLDDILTSIEIIKQALPEIPEGDYKVRLKRKLRAKAGEAYGRVELSRGTMDYYIKTEEKALTPYRLKIRGPSFSHFYAGAKLLVGAHVADIPMIISSLDVCPADLDR